MRKLLYPENIFVIIIALGMMTGGLLMFTRIAPRVGICIVGGTFAVGWIPLLIVIAFSAIPELWSNRRGK